MKPIITEQEYRQALDEIRRVLRVKPLDHARLFELDDAVGDYEAVRTPEAVDYRILLKKYIRHVGECEGANFIETCRHSDVKFTDAEHLALLELEREGDAEIED